MGSAPGQQIATQKWSTNIRVCGVCFPLILPPSFPFRPCPLSYPFSPLRLPFSARVLKFRRVIIRGAPLFPRLSEEICLLEGSQGPLGGGLFEGSVGSLRGSAGVSAGPCRGPFSEGSDPILVTLGNCWIRCLYDFVLFSMLLTCPRPIPLSALLWVQDYDTKETNPRWDARALSTNTHKCRHAQMRGSHHAPPNGRLHALILNAVL